jgi:hypothetical protein
VLEIIQALLGFLQQGLMGLERLIGHPGHIGISGNDLVSPGFDRSRMTGRYSRSRCQFVGQSAHNSVYPYPIA